VRQINKRTPVNKDKKNKGKNSGPMGNTNMSSTSGKTGFDSLQNNQTSNNSRDKQNCCILL
jgi:hypothetical protein